MRTLLTWLVLSSSPALAAECERPARKACMDLRPSISTTATEASVTGSYLGATGAVAAQSTTERQRLSQEVVNAKEGVRMACTAALRGDEAMVVLYCDAQRRFITAMVDAVVPVPQPEPEPESAGLMGELPSMPPGHDQLVESRTRCANYGEASACYDAGIAYRKGRVVARDFSMDASYHRFACLSGGLAAACLDLAEMYGTGEGVPRDLLLSSALRMKAAGVTE